MGFVAQTTGESGVLVLHERQEQWNRMQELAAAQDWAGAAVLLETMDVQRLAAREKQCAAQLAGALPEAEARRSPLLCVRRAQLAADLGDAGALRRALADLASLREKSREGTPARRRADDLLSAASLLKSGVDNAQLLLTLSVLYNELAGAAPEAVFSATGGRPSVLNGAKDLSQWGRNWRAVSSIVRPMLGALLAEGGKGAPEAAAAEVLYLKNDLNGAALQLAAAKNAPDAEIRFAGQALTAQLHLLDPAAKPPEELLERMAETLAGEGAGWLDENMQALAARLDIARGRLAQAQQWLEGREGAQFDRPCPENAYVLHTKAMAYLALDRCREAAMLTEDLLLTVGDESRPIDRIGYLLDGALACERLGGADAALDKVCEALALAQPYGYVRLFADRGAPMLALLTRCARERAPEQAAFLKRAVDGAKQMSLVCPALYAPAKAQADAPQLTAAEVEILHLLAQGKTNKDICDAMGIKLSTAKFHIHNLCEKLGAANRTAAVSQAKKQGML